MNKNPPKINNTSKDELSPELQKLHQMLETADLPVELSDRAQANIERVQRLFGSSQFYTALDNTYRFIELVIDLPWNKRSEDNLDLQVAGEILETTHYGLRLIKDRILEYIAVLALQKEAKRSSEREEVIRSLQKRGVGMSPVLMFTGLPGVGKTSIAYSVAKAMNREFIRIAMGGMGSASHLRGDPQMMSGSEPGMIVKGLRRAQTKNPVILLDEIDRAAEAARADIMGVLLELLDPQQNSEFMDYYLNYPFDLSEVMFLCSGNKTAGISNAVLDRMEVIQMPGYTDEEKIIIAREYLLPQALQVAGMDKDDVVIEEAVWPLITRPLGFDAGIRTMNRTVEAVIRRCARQRVSGTTKKFVVNEENIRDYVPE